MPRYMLEHRHAARECGVVFASFNAFDSPLRHQVVSATCSFGSHRIWWELEAETEAEALAQLPATWRSGLPLPAFGTSDALILSGQVQGPPDVRRGPGGETLR